MYRVTASYDVYIAMPSSSPYPIGTLPMSLTCHTCFIMHRYTIIH